MPLEHRQDLDVVPRRSVHDSVSTLDHFANLFALELWNASAGERRTTDTFCRGDEGRHPSFRSLR